MKFAFSTVSCPAWDFETISARAKEYGYDGVEIRGFRDEAVLTAANVFLTDRKKLAALFKENALQVCCLASSIAMTAGRTNDSRKSNAQAADRVRIFIDAAAEIDCSLVKILDAQVSPGQNRSAAGAALGDWLMPLGDYAAERGVTIVVENLLSFRSAREMWTLLDGIDHPSIACCWDIFSATQIGESPFVSVPTLNSKIAHAHVKDAMRNGRGFSYCKLGEGNVPVQTFLTRLLGIGYGGWVTLEWEKASHPNLAEPEDVLPQAIAKLREWTEAAKQKARPSKKVVAAH